MPSGRPLASAIPFLRGCLSLRPASGQASSNIDPKCRRDCLVLLLLSHRRCPVFGGGTRGEERSETVSSEVTWMIQECFDFLVRDWPSRSLGGTLISDIL